MNPEDQRQPVGENITENVTILSPSQLEISTESLAPEQRSPTLDETRKELAKFLTYTLAVTIAASFVVVVALTIMSGFFVDEKKTSSFDKTSALAKDLIVTILTSQIGLVGTVIGFYFGSRGNAD